MTRTGTVFERMGIRPVINASGIYTDLGGSRLSPGVWGAMTEVNDQFVKLADLLDGSGRLIAGRLGAEAAWVTPGAAASIALMVSAAMTGGDGAAGQRLPDTAGLKNEIVLQRNHRYKYDRQITMTGAKLVIAGGAGGTTEAEVEAAIGPNTAALFLPAHLDRSAGTVGLARLVAVGRSHGIPVLVDAAYLCWPLELMPSHIAAGADLVCFSAKYFGGPNAGGFIAGSRRMIDWVSVNGFLRYESGPYRTFGRPLKMDRQTIVGVVVALEEWLALDHSERWARYRRQVAELADLIGGIPGISSEPKYFTMDERLVPEPVNSLVVTVPSVGRRTAQSVAAALEAGSPSISCSAEGSTLIVCMDVLRDEEIPIIGAALRALLEPNE
ncbi:MAG: beta-eliminating lyase-related protein [Gemmatimonadota bacterium]